MSPSFRTVLRRLVFCSSAGALASAGCLDRPVAPAKPQTTNVFVAAVPQNFVDKIDLLFMIDNSVSMKDKQDVLEEAVPVLVQRLVTPRCLDDAGNPVGTADTNGACTTGIAEFKPVKDIHIGVITSSLGSHGGTECVNTAMGRTPDDRAELLPIIRTGANLASWNGAGFLAWDPGQDKNQPPGERDLGALIDNVRAQVSASGEVGCGFESSLEAWYRFLVDPEPPVSMSVDRNRNVRGPVNTALLEQRRAFLRPDSLLAIVMLTDENDCSINDDDDEQGFFVTTTGTSGRLWRASAACAAEPNDRCCYPCAANAAPEGCTPKEQDAECSKKQPAEGYALLAPSEDNANLRCFDQKRRFGIDFLYPTQRYVDALTKHTVKNRAGMDVANPIFASPAGGRQRPESQVVLAGIVGVPWQDIATDATRAGTGLEYLDAAELRSTGRWDLILGNPSTGTPPADPHMHESMVPRSGTNPLLGIPIAPATSQNATENPINGHEQNVPAYNDLQYACTFRLPMPHECTDANELPCDCNGDEYANNRSLCEYRNGPNTNGTQHSAKAYPGLRHLEVLKGIGDNGIVASICPKNTQPAPGLTPASDPSYGYNPAVASILDVFRERIGAECLPRKLEVEKNPESERFGKVPCEVIEAVRTNGECVCDPAKGRTPVTSKDLRRGAFEGLKENKDCGGISGVDCNSYCLCEVEQLTGPEGDACLAGSTDPNTYGYCYIDAEQGIGNPKIVEGCKPNQQRVLRWMGEGLPSNGSTMLMACFGAAL